MHKFILGSLVLAALGAANAAEAADLPIKAPVYTPPTFSWSGVYFGLSAGVARSSGVKGDDCTFFCSDIDFVKESGTFGGQIGYNFQIGNAVVGAEVDLSWIDGNRSILLCSQCTFGALIDAERDFLGTARVRTGLAVGRTLVYVTAGLAFSDGEDKITVVNNNTGARFPTHTQEFRFGWVAGGGVEQALWDQLTVRLEALYHSFGSAQLNYVAAGVNGGSPIPFYLASSVVTARLGLNYRYGGPLLAKY
jgi:outer membrane immunogenic protein